MKLLALDIGEKRIGVAVTDEEGIIARPLLKLDATNNFFSALGKVIEQEKPDKIIFGIPRHMDGKESQAVEGIRKLAEGVKHEFGLEVDFQDETVTSIEAEKRLKDRGMDQNGIKENVDAEAAAIILEDYLKG